MKKRLYSIICLCNLVSIMLCACGSKVQLPEDSIVYEQETNDEEGYSYLKYGDKEFVPYCAYEKKYLGDCIGYCDIPADEYTEASRVYIFEFKGYSSDEWIIETMELNNCNEGMILREINATDIPEGLESEYEWNNTSETVKFQATTIEATNNSFLVKPVDGSLELGSADEFSIPNKEHLELQTGELVEITYNGEILETYPAQLGEVYNIAIVTINQED